jgi:hypothetical protein
MQNQPIPPRPEPQSAPGESRVSAQRERFADKAEHAVEHVKDKALERAEAVRDQARSEIDQTRQQIAERIHSVSSALRSAGDNMRDENEFVASYVGRASEGIDKLANYVTSATPRDVVRDVQQFARQRPAWFFGGAFLMGLAAGRLLKASGSAAAETLDVPDRGDEPLVPYALKDIGP